MQVYSEYYDEYKRRHDNLWSEMEEAILQHGAASYSIFLNPNTGQLFAYLEVENEDKWDALANTDICKKWWEYMATLMETNDDNSPVSIDLKEVFHLSKS